MSAALPPDVRCRVQQPPTVAVCYLTGAPLGSQVMCEQESFPQTLASCGSDSLYDARPEPKGRGCTPNNPLAKCATRVVTGCGPNRAAMYTGFRQPPEERAPSTFAEIYAAKTIDAAWYWQPSHAARDHSGGWPPQRVVDEYAGVGMVSARRVLRPVMTLLQKVDPAQTGGHLVALPLCGVGGTAAVWAMTALREQRIQASDINSQGAGVADTLLDASARTQGVLCWAIHGDASEPAVYMRRPAGRSIKDSQRHRPTLVVIEHPVVEEAAGAPANLPNILRAAAEAIANEGLLVVLTHRPHERAAVHRIVDTARAGGAPSWAVLAAGARQRREVIPARMSEGVPRTPGNEWGHHFGVVIAQRRRVWGQPAPWRLSPSDVEDAGLLLDVSGFAP